MRTIQFTSRAAVVAAAALLTTCGNKQESSDYARSPPAPTTPQTAEDELRAAHREFQDAVAKRLADLETKYGELRAKAAAATADERERLQKLVDDVGAKKDDVAAEFRRLREASADKWDEVRDKLERGLADLERRAAEALK